MKRILMLTALVMAAACRVAAIDNNTVEIVYNGATATITVAQNIQSYVTVSSGTSSHVKIVQSATFAGVDATTDNEDGVLQSYILHISYMYLTYIYLVNTELRYA